MHKKKSNYSISHRKHDLKRKYGISLDGYEYMYRKQEGKCKICGDFYKVLHIDHNHSTGDVRGFLCPTCNIGLGLFKDSPKSLINAAKYLKEADAFKELYDLIYL